LRSIHRPAIVTWLSVIVLIYSAVQFVGAIAWFTLPDISLTVPRGYLLVKNLVWGTSSLAAGAGLLSGQGWALSFTRWAATLASVFYIGDAALLSSSQFALQSRTFTIFLTLVSLIAVLLILSRPSVKDYFRREAG
jgi:hypothetical protein